MTELGSSFSSPIQEEGLFGGPSENEGKCLRLPQMSHDPQLLSPEFSPSFLRKLFMIWLPTQKALYKEIY